jgi:cytochrome b561
MSTLPNSAAARPSNYDAVARSLHWLMALLIVATFVLGLVVDVFPKSWEYGIVLAHKDIGIAILILLAARLAWRLRHKPPHSSELSPLMAGLSGVAHVGLYLLMLAVPILGIAYAVQRGQSFDFGLFSVGPFIADSHAAARPVREIHELSSYALIGIAALHALAALWHHFIRKDGVLRRMLAEA